MKEFKRAGRYNPRSHFLGRTYNDQISLQTYQMRIVIRYFDVQYLVYYQSTM